MGDFGVRLANPYEGEIINEPAELSNGSWLDEGYPFYSGNMTYMTSVDIPGDGKRTFLRLNRPSGILYAIRVNGKDAGKVPWRPFELECTPCLQAGRNELEIEVISSRRSARFTSVRATTMSAAALATSRPRA